MYTQASFSLEISLPKISTEGSLKKNIMNFTKPNLHFSRLLQIIDWLQPEGFKRVFLQGIISKWPLLKRA